MRRFFVGSVDLLTVNSSSTSNTHFTGMKSSGQTSGTQELVAVTDLLQQQDSFVENHAANDATKPSLSTLADDSILHLPDKVFHHWIKVLRAKEGDNAVLFDGLGGERQVLLESIRKKTAQVRLQSHTITDRTPPYYTTIAIVMSRGDRMDYAIQKAAELGTTSIQLLTSQHGEVRLKPAQISKKMGHWQQVAVSACEQCGLNRPPIIHAPIAIEQWLQQGLSLIQQDMSYLLHSSFYRDYYYGDPFKLVLHVPNKAEDSPINITTKINEELQSTGTNAIKPRFDILIGAEGGLSQEEYSLSRQYDYTPWQIGNRVLRTETAPVAALTALLCYHDMVTAETSH